MFEKWVREQINRDIEVYCFKRGYDMQVDPDMIDLGQVELAPYIRRARSKVHRAMFHLQDLVPKELLQEIEEGAIRQLHASIGGIKGA